MEVPFTPDQQDRLSGMAVAQGCATEALVLAAVERLLSHDEWFSRGVDKGIEAADRGELVQHDEVRRMIESRYPA